MIDENGKEVTLVTGDAELAKLLQVNVSRVRGWRKAGVIPCSRTGKRGILYFKEDVLKALRSAQAAQATAPAAATA